MSDYNDVFGDDDCPPWLTASKESFGSVSDSQYIILDVLPRGSRRCYPLGQVRSDQPECCYQINGVDYTCGWYLMQQKTDLKSRGVMWNGVPKAQEYVPNSAQRTIQRIGFELRHELFLRPSSCALSTMSAFNTQIDYLKMMRLR